MRFKRPGLTPLKVILAYALALVLVLSHEANRLADWLADLGRADLGAGSTVALNLAADLRTSANNYKLTDLNQAEDRLVAFLTPTQIVGTVLAKPPLLAPKSPSVRGPIPLNPSLTPRPQEPDFNQAPAADPSLTASNSAPPALNPSLEPAAALSPDAATPTQPLDPIPRESVFKKILLTGDSMMLEGLGPSLQKRFTQIEGLVVSREGKYATGLCRLDYFDWFKFFNDLLTAKEPDLVIISIGANDTQDIVDDQRRRHLVTSDGWREIYGQRVQDLLKIAAAKKAEVIWVGLPIMGREPYNGRAAVINQVAKAACQKSPNCRFFDAWDILADDQGRYSTFLPINDKKQRVRAKDSIHLTEAGGRIMAEAFWTYLSDLATFGETKKADPTLLAAQSPESRAIISDPALTPKVNPADVLGAFPPQAANLTSTDLSPTDSNPTNSSQTNLNPPDESLSQGHEPPFFPKADQNDAGADQTAPATAPIPTDPDGPTDLKAEAKISQGPAALKDQKPVLTSAALVEASLNSKALSREVKYQVFAPKGPGPFPAVFLLPGVGENYTAFATHFGQALFQKAESLGLALVTIDSGPDGWYLDSPIKAHSNYATHFFQELLPDVLAKFPLIPDQLALLGISMGGHGALRFALVAPSRFKAVSSLSAVLDLTSHGGDQAINRFLNLKPLLGPYPERADLWRAASVYQTTRKRPEALSGTGLFLTVGLSDRLTLAENRQYNRLLTELGVPHRYREDSGGHDWKLWAKELDDHLDFLAQRLRAPR